mmetsp:Transcript_4797/g.9477  ORF Transcript_4797/g.9477 Transcript_4797/m.9477 type:complete len:354 (+) Transcript_4797:136-1197(+)|eukprot:CAMPEP_0181289952 /NCGR_PEP_ID=MMETSP1101-20121128/1160_1 /TAXON_ID=46948 /ORGANISM="Rhodomonas abbreviata, Strain Caron Lab Isolate" /LENGTH=353 /DNA_ID=CAMNT_0023394215 /DNA_START=136 /DNA_END=1197 /DNA_ORIENTATION=+
MADELAAQLGKLDIKEKDSFILQPNFWDDEGGGANPALGAPLLDRNNGLLQTDKDSNSAVLERAAKWVSLCGADKVTELPKVQPVKGAGTSESIIWRDAERTFKTEPFRKQMIQVLELVADGDYHQGMGYFCGFLLLLVPPADVSKILHRVGTDEKYTPGYWKGQPEAFVRDALVYQRLLKTRLPDVHAHLAKASLVPEAYAQKWFVGLCVHTMPFGALVELFEAFLAEGHMFLFKLSVALVSAIQHQILDTKPAEVNKLFELLRLDKKLFPDSDAAFFHRIVAAAKELELSSDEVAALRAEEMAALQEKLRLVRAREKELADDGGSDDEIVFSDEDDDEEDEAARLARLAAQ